MNSVKLVDRSEYTIAVLLRNGSHVSVVDTGRKERGAGGVWVEGMIRVTSHPPLS